MSCFAYSRLSGKPLDHYFIVPALLPATSWFTLHDIALRWIGFFCIVVLYYCHYLCSWFLAVWLQCSINLNLNLNLNLLSY